MKASTRKRKYDLPEGVYPHPTTVGRYLSASTYLGKRRYLGISDSVEEAAEKVRLFRLEHPKMAKGPWQPGDEL